MVCTDNSDIRRVEGNMMPEYAPSLSCEIGLAGWFDLGHSPSYQIDVRGTYVTRHVRHVS
jgi:hypothetical protein